jgi:hypothetical protein
LAYFLLVFLLIEQGLAGGWIGGTNGILGIAGKVFSRQTNLLHLIKANL